MLRSYLQPISVRLTLQVACGLALRVATPPSCPHTFCIQSPAPQVPSSSVNSSITAKIMRRFGVLPGAFFFISPAIRWNRENTPATRHFAGHQGQVEGAFQIHGERAFGRSDSIHFASKSPEPEVKDITPGDLLFARRNGPSP